MELERLPVGSQVDGVTTALQRQLAAVWSQLRRRASGLYFGDWFIVLLTLGVAAVAGGRLVGIAGVTLSLGVSLSVAIAIVVANSGNPLLNAVGAGVAVLGGVLVASLLVFVAVLTLGSGTAGVGGGLALLCLVLAGLGSFLTPAQTVSLGAIARTILMSLLSAVGVLLVLAISVLPHGELSRQLLATAVALVGAGVGAVTSSSPTYGLPTFLLLAGLAALMLRTALDSLPLGRVLPADRRDEFESWLARGRELLSRTFKHGMMLAVPTGAIARAREEGVAAVRAVDYTRYVHVDEMAAILPDPVGGLLWGLLLSEAVRLVLLYLIVGGVVVAGGVATLKRLRRGLARFLVHATAPIVGGMVVGAVAGYALIDPSLPDRLAAGAPDSVPTEAIVLLQELPLFAAGNALVLLTLLVFGTALFGFAFLRSGLLLPNRAGSAALASLGLFGVAVVAVITGRVGLGVGVVVVALSVWDVGEFRTGLREELPPTAPTLRVEAVHAASSLLVGVTLAIVSWGLFVWIVPAVAPPNPQVAATGLLILGLVSALLALQVKG